MATPKKVELGEPTQLRRATVSEIADRLKDAFIVVATERADRTEAEAVVSEIISDLEAQKREVTMKLLGLDNRWGKWEVDHTNNRQSPLTDYLASEGKEQVRMWVRQAVDEVLTPDAKDKFMKECKKALLADIKQIAGSYKTREYVDEMITGIRRALLDQAAKELRTELGILEKP
jgi:hypothetical protein